MSASLFTKVSLPEDEARGAETVATGSGRRGEDGSFLYMDG